MENLSLEQKQQQFHEFFTIKHNIIVNMQEVEAGFVLPSAEQLTDHMPYAFRIASDLSSIDSKALRSLRGLGEHAVELAEFLNQQSRKIDLLMSLVLQQQDEVENRYLSYEFGGGGVTVICDQEIALGKVMELKLFLNEEATAIFCFGEVISCKPVDEQFYVSLIFTRIREQDQDLLVRASLHQQSVQLRRRTEQLKNDKN
jgi:Tfp pilus assembly protein PilZ